ncbi:hypothetical protein J6590_040723 [Homalodisca vitripennis]|nr:hypothetical protein J6590_040723 [Homalodisca vitripennis]
MDLSKNFAKEDGVLNIARTNNVETMGTERFLHEVQELCNESNDLNLILATFANENSLEGACELVRRLIVSQLPVAATQEEELMTDANTSILCQSYRLYPIGQQELPYFTEWVVKKLNVNLYERKAPKDVPKEFPPSKVGQDFLDRMTEEGISFSVDGMDRLVRSHGQTLHDIFNLRCSGTLERIPDLVIWPGKSS